MKDVQPRRLFSIRHLTQKITNFSIAEKTIFFGATVLLVFSIIGILIAINSTTLSSVPRRGGVLNEGLLGTPRFINPLLAQKDADRDLSILIYSGLLRLDSERGIQTDLAQSYEISEDGTVYIVTLKDNLTFHDGTPLTADDVLYTVALAQNGNLRTAVQSTWNSVFVEKIDEKTISFTISEAYTPFVYNLTLGILPKHIWENVSVEDFLFSEYNTHPIGSGPFRISDIQELNGVPTQYTLQAFDNFALGKPFVETIKIRVFSDTVELQSAYEKGVITSGYNIIDSRSNSEVTSGTLPRSFAVYLNQNNATLFATKSMREAFMQAIDKQALIDEVLGGNAEALNSTIPDSLYPFEKLTQDESPQGGILTSRALFDDLGYTYNEATQLLENEDGETIAFTLTTANVPQLVAVGEYLITQWQEVGIDAKIEIYESIDLTQRIIRPRDFEGLLFGQVLPHGLDLYSFWHSSQRNDPGLNIAQYTNIDVDKALTELRRESEETIRAQQYSIFNRELTNDIPALFLFSPRYTYTHPKNITVSIPEFIINSSERFSLIHTWYTETDSVWPFIRKIYD